MIGDLRVNFLALSSSGLLTKYLWNICRRGRLIFVFHLEGQTVNAADTAGGRASLSVIRAVVRNLESATFMEV